MLMLKQAIQERFPEGGEWASQAVATIDDLDWESSVHDVGSGWMKVGDQEYRLVDTLFVLTEERLGFGQTTSGAAERWVPLSAITAIDAIEGTGHPLESIEIHLAGGLAMLIGLPEPFVEILVSVLQRQAGHAVDPQIDEFPDELAVAPSIADASTLEQLPPSPWVETEVHEEPWGAEPKTEFAPVEFAPVEFAPVESAPVESAPVDGLTDDGPRLPSFLPPTAPPLLFDPSVPFDAPDAFGVAPDEGSAGGQDLDGGPSVSADVESPAFDVGTSFFEDSPELEADEPGFLDADLAAGDVGRGIVWPEPFKGVSYLGGHADHPRKRKNAVLVFSSAGVAMTGGGMGGGQFAVAWAQVSSVDVQGADEVKFTHNQRIDLNSSAVIVELLTGDVLVFEVKLRRPATMRSTLAPILSFVRALRAQG